MEQQRAGEYLAGSYAVLELEVAEFQGCYAEIQVSLAFPGWEEAVYKGHLLKHLKAFVLEALDNFEDAGSEPNSQVEIAHDNFVAVKNDLRNQWAGWPWTDPVAWTCSDLEAE